jgi:hypothetical protein
VSKFVADLFAAGNPLWYYYPLAVVIGIVYKTTQYDTVRGVVKGVVHFLVSVTLFMIALAVALYAVSEWL